MSKWVYNFGFGQADGNASMKEILGGKGANLAEMNKLGLSVPPGFTISTKVCKYYYKNEKSYPKELFEQVKISEMSSDWCYADIQDVKRNMALTHYPIDKVTFVRGKVEDTIPHQIPSKRTRSKDD